jgi:NADPH:quinone reductase-like Zn-dependent oxidoreductase
MIADAPNAPLRLADVAKPRPRAGEVLVRVLARGLNPLDGKIRAGAAPHAKQPLPAILGLDLAGVVEEVGPDVEHFEAGDEVYGMTGGVGGLQGSLAEFAAVDARLLAVKASSFSMRDAAATPLAFITAWEGLVDRAHVAAGHTVLVQGGAGGVGHIAVQIARAFGATAFATAHANDAQFVESLGAIAIDYRRPVEDFVAALTNGQGFDIVFDTVGGPVLDASFVAVKKFGHVVSALGWGTHALAPLSFKGGSYSGVFTLMPLLSGLGRDHHGAIMREATRLADSMQLNPRVNPSRFSLEAANEAFRAMESGGAKGKLVVEV